MSLLGLDIGTTGRKAIVFSEDLKILGAAYRQRTQIQVFLFIFIAVAIGLILEKIEDKRTLEIDRQKTIARKLRARFHEQQKAI